MSSPHKIFTLFQIQLWILLVTGSLSQNECPFENVMIEEYGGNGQLIELRTVKTLIESFQGLRTSEEVWAENFIDWGKKLSQWMEQSGDLQTLTYGQLSSLLEDSDVQQPSQSIIVGHGGMYHFSTDEVKAAQFRQLFCTRFSQPKRSESIISEQAHLRTLQIMSENDLVLLDEKMLDMILDEINNVRVRKYGLPPLERQREFQQELVPFLSEERVSLNHFIMDLGYEVSYAGSHSGPSFLLPALIAQSCRFCYFQTTTKIALLGHQVRGRVYQVYYALNDAPIVRMRSQKQGGSQSDVIEPNINFVEPAKTVRSEEKNVPQQTLPIQSRTQSTTGEQQENSVQETKEEQSGSFGELFSSDFFKRMDDQPPKELQSTPQPEPQSQLTLPFPENPITSSAPNQQISSKQTKSTQFVGIALYHEVPENFLKGEIFTFRGKILRIINPAQSTPMTISFQNVETGDYFACPSRLPAGVVEFQIPCEIKVSGEGYYLSVFAGMLGRASASRRNIKEVEKTNRKVEAPAAPTDLQLEFKDNQLDLKWSSRHPITKLVITQGNQKVQRLFSNFQNSFSFDIAEFGNFMPDRTVRIEIQEASSQTTSAYARNSQFSRPGVLTFFARENMFAQFKEDQIQLSPIPYVVQPGTRVQFSGRITEQTDNILLILTPSQEFLEIELVPDIIRLRLGMTFNTSFLAQEEGVYIIEINNAGGRAILNRPIYVQDGYPLIPDFDSRRKPITNVRAVANQQPPTLQQKRQVMLDLINEKRAEFNVQPVYLDDTLNRLAQNYAEDMVRRNYTGHVNPEGEDPSDRARKMGITTPVGQNIANNPNITDAHYRLSRSNIHLRNTVRPFWTRVGLGFAQNSMGVFVVTQEYSSRDFDVDPLQKSEVGSIKSILVRDIIEISPTVQSENIQLSADLSEWQNGSQAQGLMTFLRGRGYSGMRLRNLKAPFNEQTPEMIKQRRFFFNDDRQQVGVTVRMVENQLLQIFVVFI